MKSIAFCIPVMGRNDDVKATLVQNLDVIKQFQGRVKIYINSFDADDELGDWIESKFSQEVADGALVFNKCDVLKHWHFSWAKNSFQTLITENYYSSLDGDNFLSVGEVDNLLAIIDQYEQVIFHGFSGAWGDGTSGRVTLPAELYKKYGYINQILPRQVDEIGLLANIIKNENIPYVSYEKVNIFQMSKDLKSWIELENFKVNNIQIPKPLELKVPLNPKGAGYTAKDHVLNFYQKFNTYYTYVRLSKSTKSYNHFKKHLDEIVIGTQKETLDQIASKLFDFKVLANHSDQITLYAVVKNDTIFLDSWIKHYKNIGVQRFVIVDDYSDVPLNDVIQEDGVFIFRPLVGDFKNSKVHWINMLMKLFQKQGSWCLTVDSDEFICLEEYRNSLSYYCSLLDDKKQPFGTGLLLDMLPNESYSFDKAKSENFLADFDSFYVRNHSTQYGYENIKSIQWAFAEYWAYSFRLDVRWRFFQTIDSLRKFPIFKFSPTVELNQGFHALTLENKKISPSWAFKYKELILPVKHYKFVSLFNKVLQARTFDTYHERTEQNLKRIVNSDVSQLKTEFDRSPFVTKYSYQKFSDIFYSKIGFYRVIGNNLPNLHSEDQSVQNLQHILTHETKFDGVDKHFVLNRIVSVTLKEQLLNLLKKHKCYYHIIDFDPVEFVNQIYDFDRLPNARFYFSQKQDWEQLYCDIALRESRNRYLMNNNGARNFCVENLGSVYDWVLPWDGNSFLSDVQFNEIKAQFKEYWKTKSFKYIAVPMERALSNKAVHAKAKANNAVEEPQLIFHTTAKERFNENRVYGNQPKVELFKRLGFKGVWDDWNKLYPWETLQAVSSSEAGTVVKAGTVFRLYSGNEEAAKNAKNRGMVRSQAIVEYIDSVERDYISNLCNVNQVVDIIRGHLSAFFTLNDSILAENQIDRLDNFKHRIADLLQQYQSGRQFKDKYINFEFFIQDADYNQSFVIQRLYQALENFFVSILNKDFDKVIKTRMYLLMLLNAYFSDFSDISADREVKLLLDITKDVALHSTGYKLFEDF